MTTACPQLLMGKPLWGQCALWALDATLLCMLAQGINTAGSTNSTHNQGLERASLDHCRTAWQEDFRKPF